MKNNVIPKQYEQIHHASKHLQALTLHVHFLQQIQTALNALVPADLKPHCQVSNFREGVLHVQTDNAVWAQRLHFLTIQWQQALQRILPELTKIRVHVTSEQEWNISQQPIRKTPNPHVPTPWQINTNTADTLQSTEFTEPALTTSWQALLQVLKLRNQRHA